MNYRKIFDTVGWIIIVICVIAGFVFVLNFFAQLPSEKEVEIQLLPGEIPPNTKRVFDIKDVEIIGNITEVSGTYDFYRCNQTFASVNIVKKSNVKIVEFYIRGTTSNETFDYRFYQDIPLVGGWGKYNIDSISSFNDEKVILKYYMDVGFASIVAIIIMAIIIAIVAGVIALLVMRIIEIFLERGYKLIKPLIEREEKN
ncbi:hypothetical protein KAI56_03480 [Candidatus Parcubacteria bacterium]|nr:hypothetical protein [Candidatus Parcubacteria bacterium]